MKTILLSCFIITLLVLSACEKPEKDSISRLSESERSKPISDSTRLKVIEDWQKFRKDTGESLLQAQEKLDHLEDRCTDEKSPRQVKLRRIFNSCDYKLEKLKSKLLRQGIKFRNNIDHFTTEDLLKNESWRTAFNAKLVALHSSLDEGLAINP